MSEPAPPRGFDRLSGALQYQIINTLRWPGLRPVQQQSIDAIADGDNCVILAPTAGGKTEASFFPLLSAMHVEDWRPVSVVYLSPIRALLNNQEDRIQQYAAMLSRRAFKWHGDTTESARKKFLAEPTDILLITPESIEAMLMGTKVPARELFAGLQAVIIDEIHAFADDDRGAHLASILERLSRYAGRDVQRIGLSATVGNPDEILSWVGGSSKRAGRVVDPGGAKATPKLSIDFVASMPNAGLMVEQLHPGEKRLVFVDSRRGAEELSANLNQRGVLAYVSHGSLSVTARRDAETAFHQGRDCVIVATSALELGIDVGDLDRVLQIDSPNQVASFLQRMGRTGRRESKVPNCTFLVVREKYLLRAAAIVQLYRDGFVESVRPSRRASHIFAHQVMSLAVQCRGLPRGDLWAWLDGAAPYEDLTRDERASIVDHMLENDILADQDGRLWLGSEGEKRYGRANFRPLYAVFESPRMLVVRHANTEVGTVDASFLAALSEPEPDGSFNPGTFTLGGRNWLVVHIDWEKGRCVVQPAPQGKPARWSGGPRWLSYELCQCMQRILISDEVDPCWSERARASLRQSRAEHEFLRNGDPFVQDGQEKITWHNFAGGAANLLLARVLEKELGGRVISRNLSLSFTKAAGKSMAAVNMALDALRQADKPVWDDAMHFAPDASKSQVSKFQRCLPENLVRDLLVRKVVDLRHARRALGLDAAG